MEQEDLNRPRHNGTDALTELEAATKNVAAALVKSVAEYEELMQKYQALQETVRNGAAKAQVNSEPGGSLRHVVVMIDAYDNELTGLFLRYAKESIANQKYTLEDALDDWFGMYRPDLEHVHRIVQIYADYGVLMAGSAQSGHSQDVGAQRPLANLLSTSGICFDFINVISEKDVIRKMQGLISNHIRDVACISFLFSTDRCSHLSAPGEYSAKTKDMSTELAALLSDLSEGKLPSRAPACSHGEVEQVRKTAGNDTDTTENETAHRKHSHGYFENNRYIAPTPPKASMESFVPPTANNPSRPTVTPVCKPDYISINAAGHRLDPAISTPTHKERSMYRTRTKRKNLCTVFFIYGKCGHKICRYDHTAITPSMLHVLKFNLSEFPCGNEGACRAQDCLRGHVCARKGCKGTNYAGCRFGPDAHGVDLEVANQVDPGHIQKKMHKENEVRTTTPTVVVGSKSSMEDWPTMGNLIDI